MVEDAQCCWRTPWGWQNAPVTWWYLVCFKIEKRREGEVYYAMFDFFFSLYVMCLPDKDDEGLLEGLNNQSNKEKLIF